MSKKIKHNHMNKVLLVSIILLFAACEPEEVCQSCLLIEESNRNNLELKCAGLANSYPAFTTQISVENMGLVCGSAEISALSANETETTGSQCGFTWTKRKRLDCQ